MISDNDLKGIKGQTLIKSDKKLSEPGNSKLNALGKFQCMLESHDKFSVQDKGNNKINELRTILQRESQNA